MPAHFPPAFELVCQLEGGYSPQDNGRGPVNCGLTQQTWDDMRKQNPAWAPYPADVKDLTRPHLSSIYRDHFWAQSGAFRLNDQKLAEAYFLNYINVDWPRVDESSWKRGNRASIALQRIAGVKVDGLFGPMSAEAVNHMDPTLVLHRMNQAILEHYERLAAEKPALYADDLKGWKARLKHLEER